MVGLLVLIIFVGALIAVANAAISTDLRQKARAAELAGALDLEVAKPDPPGQLSMYGTIDGFSVRVEGHPNRGASGAFTVTISGAAIPGGLTVQRRLLASSGDHATGDHSFDRVFRVEGPPERISSCLTANVRAAFLAVPQSVSASLDCGHLTAILSLSRDASTAVDAVRQLIALAQSFRADKGTTVERLVREFRGAKSTAVAATVFSRLMAVNPPDQIAREAVNEALGGDQRELWVLALAFARSQHAERLREIFEIAKTDDELRAAAIDAMRRAYEPAPVDLAALSSSAGPKTRAAIADFFGVNERVSDEGVLLAMLADGDPQVQSSSARALARVGTVRAVDPLREWSRGVFRSVQVKELADEAIRAIRSRVALVAGPGQLSLASGEERPGAVSLSTGTGGALSVDPASDSKD